jgi:hypothetical protein
MRSGQGSPLLLTKQKTIESSKGRYERHPFWPHLYLAMFGAGWATSFDFGVRVYGAEIISLIGFLFLPWRKVLDRYLNLRKIILIYLMWIGAITLSDLINQSSIFDWVRNSATPLMGGVYLIVCCAALSANPRALLTLLFFTALAKGLLGDATYGDAFQDITLSLETIQENSNIVKVRIEPVLTSLIILVACVRKNNQLNIAVYLFVMTGAFYLLMDARSGGLIFLAAAAFLAKIQLGVDLRRRRFLIGLVTVLVVSVGYTAYVKYTLAYNPTGQNGKQLQQLENPYNPLGLLAQGRSEWSVMPLAISERPLLGWGSWAEDENLRFSYIQAEKTSGENYTVIEEQENKTYIPFHSIVGSVWLWSGILGFGLILWLLRTIWNIGIALNLSSSQLTPAAAVMFFSLLWHYFFSPPMVVRVIFPIALATLIVVTDRTQKTLKNNYKNG